MFEPGAILGIDGPILGIGDEPNGDIDGVQMLKQMILSDDLKRWVLFFSCFQKLQVTTQNKTKTQLSMTQTFFDACDKVRSHVRQMQEHLNLALW